MTPSPVAKRGRGIPKWLMPALGFVVSVVCVYFAFRKFDYAQLGRDIQHLLWGYIVLAIVFEIISYIVDGWRWLVILSPAEKPTLLQCVQATFIGLFANDVLPAKAGEVIRPYLLTRWAGVPFSISMTSAVIERLFDGLAIVICFYFVSADMTNLPRLLRDSMLTLAISVGIITALFLFVLFYKSHAHRVVSGRAWTQKFIHLLDELHLLGNWRTLGIGFAMSFVYFLFQFLAVVCLARAFNFDFSLKDSSFALLVTRLVTMVPNAPGNIGTFQLGLEQALRLLMVESFNAKSFALIAYFFLMAPAAIVGAIFVVLTGLNIGELNKQAHHAQREHQESQVLPGV